MNIHTRQMNVDLTDLNSILGMAMSQIESGQRDGARNILERARLLHPAEVLIETTLGNVCVLLGDLRAAIEPYQRALSLAPTSLDVLLNLANVYHLQGDIQQSKHYAKAALAINPQSIEAEFRLALLALDEPALALRQLNALIERAPNFSPALHQRALINLSFNKIVNAMEDIDKCLCLEPNNAEILFLRGSIFLEHKFMDAAIIDLSQASQLGLDSYALRCNLGTALIAQGKKNEAIEEFAKAIEISGLAREPLFNVGTILLEAGEVQPAMEYFSEAIRIKPDYIDALNNRGAALKALKRYDESLADYKTILQYNPQDSRALLNASTINFEIKNFDVALDYANKALLINPDLANAHVVKGRILFETAKFSDAIESLSTALKILPEDPEIHASLGHAYRVKRDFDNAIKCYQNAIQLGSTNRNLHGDLLFSKLQISAFNNLEAEINTVVQGIQSDTSCASPFTLVCFSNNPWHQKLAAERYVKDCFQKKTDIDPIEHYPSHKKIRLGYYSADFHNHATMHLMAGLFEMHDRDRFETYAFSFGPQLHDGMRKRAEDAFDFFIDSSELSDKAVALASRHFEIDIAIDLKGYTMHSRPNIFSYRAAPVQINYLGFPGTMGGEFMDYIIADPVLIGKDEECFYTEKVLRLSSCYQVNDQLRPPLQRQFSRAELGLPENKFVYCSFNNNYKILPSTVDAWAQILKAVPDSVFWILADNKTAQKNLIEAFSVRGIDPERLIFAERMGAHLHLARQTCADLFLDTFPCAAHTTASDAVFAGLPILALAGETFASRVAASILYAVGLPDLVTKTMPDYIERAIELGRNPESCKQLSAYLKQTVRLSPLFNTQQTTRELEELYIQALREKQGQ